MAKFHLIILDILLLLTSVLARGGGKAGSGGSARGGVAGRANQNPLAIRGDDTSDVVAFWGTIGSAVFFLGLFAYFLFWHDSTQRRSGVLERQYLELKQELLSKKDFDEEKLRARPPSGAYRNRFSHTDYALKFAPDGKVLGENSMHDQTQEEIEGCWKFCDERNIAIIWIERNYKKKFARVCIASYDNDVIFGKYETSKGEFSTFKLTKELAVYRA